MCCSCPIAPAELASTSSPLSPLKLAYYHQLMIDRLIRRRKKAGIRNPASTFLAHPKIYPRRHPRSTRKTEVITLNYMPLRKISYEDTVNNPCEKVFPKIIPCQKRFWYISDCETRLYYVVTYDLPVKLCACPCTITIV